LRRSHIELGPAAQGTGAPQTLPAALAGAGLGGGVGLLVLAAVLVVYPLMVSDAVLVAIALGLGGGLGVAAALAYRRWVWTPERWAEREPTAAALLTVHSANRQDAAVAEFMLRGCENVTEVSRHVDPIE
jgi:hypothetical protein